MLIIIFEADPGSLGVPQNEPRIARSLLLPRSFIIMGESIPEMGSRATG